MKMKRWTALLLAALLLTLLLPGALAVDNSSTRVGGLCPSEDAKARNNGQHFYYAEVDQPWCTTPGTCWWTCVYCGNTYEETLPALGHDFHDDWFTQYEPSCETDGLQMRFCHRCQQEETRSIPALGHIWVESTIDRQEPTCTEDGSRAYVRQCSRCGMYDNATGTTNVHWETLPALGHDWGPWILDTPGTCVAKSLEYRRCNRCGITAWRDIAYGDHDWGEWQVVKPAGPGMPGLERRVCRIESSHVEEREIPALEKAKYVLKGVEKHYVGFEYSLDVYWPDDGGTNPMPIWQDAEPEWESGTGKFCTDPGRTTDLSVEPIPGETYYFYISVYNWISNEDHSIDFTQVDPDQIDVTIDGFTVTYLYTEEPHVSDEWVDYVNLHFSATYLGKPELTLTYVKAEPAKDVYDPDDVLNIFYTVENTGNVPLYVDVVSEKYLDGNADYGHTPKHVLQPGESLQAIRKHDPIHRFVKPGTATPELLGIDEITAYAYGYDAGSTSKDTGNPASALCKSNEITKEFKVGRAAPGTYILKGVSKDFPGVKESLGLMYPDMEPNPIGYTWADKEGKLDPEVSCLCLDSANSQPLASPPRKGETYYFLILLSSGFGAGDHSIDFSQIDPALVNVTLAGFDVKYLGYDYVEGESGVVDNARLYFSATCEKTDGPELTLTWVSDSDEDYNVYPGVEHKPDDKVWVDVELENSGTVQLLTYYHMETADGQENSGVYTQMDPNETRPEDYPCNPVKDFITPGTETGELYGTVTVTIWFDGLDPVTYEKLCESNQITREWRIVREGAGEELHPAISVYIWADPGAGDGKRYEGAKVVYHYEVTNTGNCPVYVPWWPDVSNYSYDASAPHGPIVIEGIWDNDPVTLLESGETYTNMNIGIVLPSEVEKGEYWDLCFDNYWYYDAEGSLVESPSVNSNELTIPLTYPEGGEPDPAKPALTLTWTHDTIWPYWGDGDWDTCYDTTADAVYEAIAHADACFDVINSGNVALDIKTGCSFGCGFYGDWMPATLPPGEVFHDSWCNQESMGESITPGTETAELLGTVDITIWAKGYDPETGEELCSAEPITRSWPVRKPGPTIWEIPEESRLTVTIDENSTRSDPAGYRLSEYWDTAIIVRNEGPVDVDEYLLHVEYGPETNPSGYGWTDSTGIASLREEDLWGYSPCDEINLNDVARGYVKVTAYVTWVDPDSGNPRESNHASVYLPVISKTGLLLTKGIANGPKNGEYFQEGEPIPWTLTVTNISNEPITDVEVLDQGVVVGFFPVLEPGETQPCNVPPHIVSEYEAEIVGTVTNIATASGFDPQGALHTWPSNPVSVPTNEKSPTPIPPWKPDKEPDPTVDPPGKLIDPPEEPHKEKDKDGDPGLKGDGNEACALKLTALGSSEARYTLHTCAEHLSAAQAAEQAVRTDPAGWQAAVEIWRGEIGKLYTTLHDRADTEEAKDAVLADQEAFSAYISAYEAMFSGHADAAQALAELLRLRCAELCAMLHTAPDALPDSLLGGYATIPNTVAAAAARRTIGRLSGSDCEVAVTLDKTLTAATDAVLTTVRGTESGFAADAFRRAQALWQMTLDEEVNARYKAADRDARKPIAAWRMALDQMLQTRGELLGILYPNHAETVQERLMNLYRDAAFDTLRLR